MPLAARPTSKQKCVDALMAFQRRSVAIGNNPRPGENWRTELCASLAAAFAVGVNSGNRLNPKHPLTDRECTLVWISIVATNAATYQIGEDLDRALLVIPTWLFEATAIERGPQVIGEVRKVHDCIVSGPAARLGTGIANAFLDWTFLNDRRGVEVLQHYIEDTAALVGRQRS